MEKRKINKINPVGLDWNWRYKLKLSNNIIFKTMYFLNMFPERDSKQ